MAAQSKIVIGVMATTEPDRRNEVFSLEVLHQMAEGINGEMAMRLGLMHNRTLPPGGKVLCARVENQVNGTSQVVSESEVFAASREVELPDGTTGMLQESIRDTRRFLVMHIEAGDKSTLAADYANFGSTEDLEAFFKDVQEQSGEIISTKHLSRKSFVPHPEIVIAIAKPLAAAFTATALGKKLMETVGKKLGGTLAEDVDKLYRIIRSTVWASAKRIHTKHQSITYVLEAAGEPNISFVAETTKPEDFIEATNVAVLDAALANVKELCDRFHAVDIQYILNQQGQWEFNYLLTETGQSIGTKKSFSRRARVVRDLLNSQRQKLGEQPIKEDQDLSEADYDQLYAPGQAMSVGGVADRVHSMSKQPEYEQIKTLGA